MKMKRSHYALWLPTLITSVVIISLFWMMHAFLHHNLVEMLQTHKRSQELTKKIEKMVSSTLNATFLGDEKGFLKTVKLSNQIHDDILLIKKDNEYNTDSLFNSYEQLYKKLISAVSYTTENRLGDAKMALEEVESYSSDLENQMDGLNNYFDLREKEVERTLFIIMILSGALLLFIALFNGFYLIPHQVIRPLEEFAEALKGSEEKYRIVADWTYDWEYWLDVDKNIAYISPSVERITGYTPKEFIQNPSLLVDIIYPDDAMYWDRHVSEAHLPNRPEEDAQEVEFRVVCKDGGVIFVDHICRPVYNHDGTYMGVRVANRDITQKVAILDELKEKNRLLDTLATTDGLSALYNRRYFDEALTREVEYAKRTGNTLALIMCDIDYFKLYNDAYGHQKGDKVIQQVADVLKATFSRTIDVVARYGGEEFVILLQATPPEEAYNLVELARENIVKLGIEHRESKVAPLITMSFGVVSCIPDLLSNGDSLLTQSDKALYQSKEKGRNCTTLLEC
ncbi:MAG: sensor domain-containing diguanylate cyclase [Campylobacterales bacterium]|nr:sensor domain-containing diguanylate cyclase [Campylobacterales bacterium]